MKRLLLIATLAALAMAKPGLYKEKEDFQYSRSSTDEGSKSGYYGAQRGNMGGNYERAHNMDGLAQHQMSGLVRQVDGELGDGSNTRTGSVFTAANSRGVYGSGHFDVKNLEGRNFQEGVSFDDSQSSSQLHSHSSLSSQSGYNAHSGLNSAAYINRQSHGAHSQSGYNGYQYMGHNGVESNLQQTQNLHAANQFGYGGQEATGYHSQSAYNGQSEYDQSKSNQYSTNTYGNAYGSNAQSRLISTMPVKVVLRPGTKVVVPVAAETYDASNSAAYDHNSENSEAELLSNQHIHNSNYKPTGAKHYESSFSYKKEWEKHDTQPVTVLPVAHPTTNPFPKNSELYEDAQSLSTGQQYQSTGAGSQGSHSHSSHSYGGYNSNVNSASSSQSHHQTAFNAQHHRTASSADSNYGVLSQGTYGTGAGADSTNQIEDIDSKPKSYHSSYSYHKSWERQGDPYVIKPASSGLNTKSSERLTSASGNQGAWSSHTYGSRYQQAQQNVLNLDDCDEHGHRRVARSYHTNQYEQQNAYQGHHHNQDEMVLGQRSQNLEDLTQQQSQSKWEQSEDLTQQQSQSKWDQSEDLTQQSQNKWDQSEDLTQQSQNKWDQSEDLTQQSQNKWDQSADLSQQSQNKWDQSQDLTQQQSQNKWDQSEDLTQQSQNKWDQSEDLGQQTQTQWDPVDDSGRLTQPQWGLFQGQQPRLDDGQQLQNTWSQWQTSDNRGMGQETETNWYNNKKPSIPNSGTEESNFFNPHSSTFSKEIPDDITGPQHFNTPINSYNKYWHQPSNGNYPTTPNNHFNRPWFGEFPFTSQNTGHVQTLNYHHQQSPVYNNAESSHQPPFNDFHPHTSWDEFSAKHEQTTNIKPSSNAHEVSTLWNLWDKVDTIEKQTISSNKNKTDESQYSLHTKPVTEQAVGSENIQTSIQNKPFVLDNGNKFWESKDFIVQTSTIKTTREESSTLSTTSTTIRNIPQGGKSPPSDVGRGDIGPEDSDKTSLSNFQGTYDGFETQPNPVVSQFPSGNRHYKTPAEIETLSQVIGSDINKDSTVVSSTTSRSINGLSESGVHYQNMGQYSGNTVTIENGKSTESDKSTLEQSVNEFGQQTENINQNNLQPQKPQKPFGTNAVPSKIETNKKPIDVIETGIFTPIQNSTLSNESIPESYPQHPRQYHMDVQNNSNKFWNKLDNGNSPTTANKFDYNPWLNQLPHVSPSTNYTTQQSNIYNDQELNTGQQNKDKQFSNFGQQRDKFDQQFETIGQQSDNLGQQSDKLDQQFENFGEQSENLGQQSEKFDQQFETIGQQSKNLGQQSEKFDQQFGAIGQQSENLGQQSEKFDQQFETIGQQSENLGQHSEKFDQQFETIGQQSDNLGQQSEKFDQQFETIGHQSDNLGQQSEKFDQQFETIGQQSNNLGQQSEKFDQQFENFGQQSENLGQQSDKIDQQFETIGQQSENLGQQSEKFDQQFETIGQQSENLGQQSEKFDQQFENFGQQNENLGQQSEKFDQQFENFGQQNENLGQQSEKFDQQFESVQQPVEQFETFWQKLDKNNKQDAGQEQINLSTPNKNPESLNPDESVETVHKIHTVEQSNERNVYNMYKEQQSEIWKQGEDLGQQIQTSWEHHQNQDNKANIENLQVIPVQKPIEKLEIPEDRAIKTETAPTKDFTPIAVSTPPETDKDKPGFWKSVGNKFVNAKDKVFSWFSRS